MKLQEYQSKQIFSRFGIPIPKGKMVVSADEAANIAAELDKKVVVKSQVLVGGRGKAGGVKLASNPIEAQNVAEEILNLTIKGLPVKKLLVEEAANIEQEFYLAITVDRTAQKPIIIASAAGGVDIEEVAANTPEKIIKIHIEPLMGLMNHQVNIIAENFNFPQTQIKPLKDILSGLWNIFTTQNATLVEINPLVLTVEGTLLAVDSKVIIDDNALEMHPEIAHLREISEENPSEREARVNDLSYVHLGGDIGCLVNGAGLAMATMDLITAYGGKPANFLDIGGGANAKKVASALRIILAEGNIQSILINIFGGITKCDDVAKGILTAMDEIQSTIPIVVRLTGTNADEGLAILENTNMITAKTLDEAAQTAIELSKAGQQ
jgi:succinyl-CoA synthetase beta subunit